MPSEERRIEECSIIIDRALRDPFQSSRRAKLEEVAHEAWDSGAAAARERLMEALRAKRDEWFFLTCPECGWSVSFEDTCPKHGKIAPVYLIEWLTGHADRLHSEAEKGETR